MQMPEVKSASGPLLEASIDDIHALMLKANWSCSDVVEGYLQVSFIINLITQF
jgi:hypothetical protein